MENNIKKDKINYDVYMIRNRIEKSRNLFEEVGSYCALNIDTIQAIENVLSELEELRKYDIRKIEFKDGMIEKAPSFTKEQIEYMNLGIALNKTTEKSELEELKETLKCTQGSWYKDTQKLETYKKIAEF